MSVTNRSSPVQVGGVIIEARELVLSFGETPALRGADLSVQRGEILAVMGPSGSGKSTLLHCLAGILVPDSGEVCFDGQRLDTMRETERSRVRWERFGFVFQFGQLVPELTAEENVALPLLLADAPRRSFARGAGLVPTAATRWLGGSSRRRDVGRTGPARRARHAGSSPIRTCCSRTSRRVRSTRSPASS